MSDDEALAKLAPWREKHRRPAWRPITEPHDAGPLASKFSGVPWLAADEEWPVCTGCGREMQLFLQLDLGSLPAELSSRFGEGLLQLFYCRDDEMDCEARDDAWMPFGKRGRLLRIVAPQGDQRANVAPENPDYLLAKSIVGWERHDDFPSPSDQEFLGLQMDFHFRSFSNFERGRHFVQREGWSAPFDPLSRKADDPNLSPDERAEAITDDAIAFVEAVAKIPEESWRPGPPVTIETKIDVKCPELGLEFTGLGEGFPEKLSTAIAGDKLSGWPAWVQNSDYAACPKCGKSMRLLFQFGSNDNLTFLFGDAGTAYLSQCATHQDVLAFSWQCS